MAEFPRNHNEPDVLLFEFISWCRGVYSFSHVEHFTVEEALESHRACNGDFIVTEIIVLPKRGKKRNPVSHKLVHLEKQYVDTWFVAAIERRAFKQMCEDADRGWRKQKDAVRVKIGLASENVNFQLDDLPEQFRRRISVSSSGCWLWFCPSRRNKRGNLRPNKRIFPERYGRIVFNGKRWVAHRFIHTLLVGEIPEGALLRHRCDTPACVNPLHLELGITEDNVRDMIDRGRAPWQRSRIK